MPYPINQRAHQFNSIQSVPVSFGLWDTALKFLSPGPRSDVTDHLAIKWSNFLQYITDLLKCGEITRDYGLKQKMAKIEKHSGKNLKILNGIWICSRHVFSSGAVHICMLHQLTDLYYFHARVQLVHNNVLTSFCICVNF